ncbi:MAG: zinc-ribbon domain-containing protein, partial [Actinomycetota bacterium]|nr:zinc-ribbon domain-containing protein [Actinomycetota bacterium]
GGATLQRRAPDGREMITYCPRCGAQYSEEFRGEWFVTGLRCSDCGLAVAEPPALLARGNEEDEVEYDLREWEPSERGLATAALLDADIPYRWEPDLVLVVPVVAEPEVDQLLDELGEVEELDDDGGIDGGGEAHGAMTDLFVAADRLQHDPTDAEVATDLLDAATTVRACLPPYGIERPVWRRIQDLAAAVVSDLEEAVDEEKVATDARALRDYLRDLV